MITCPPDFTLPCGTPDDSERHGNRDRDRQLRSVAGCDLHGRHRRSLPERFDHHADLDGDGLVRQLVDLRADDHADRGTGPGLRPRLGDQPGRRLRDPGADSSLSSVPTLGGYLTFHVASATNNAQIILAAQLPPFSTIPLAEGLRPARRSDRSGTLILERSTTTDSVGPGARDSCSRRLPELVNVTIMLQAGVVSPGGPLGFAQLTNAVEVHTRQLPAVLHVLA